MKHNRETLLLVVALLFLVFIPSGVFYIRSQGGWAFAMFRMEKWAAALSSGKSSVAFKGESTMNSEEKAIAKRQAARIQKMILANYKNLRAKDKEVSPEKNGYLALIGLSEDPQLEQLIGLRVSDQIYDKKIDREKIRKDLVPLQRLCSEIERIAALPERSSMRQGKNHGGLIRAREVKAMGDYLLLNARLAALDVDEMESFRCFSLAVNFAEHLGDIETPNFLSETVRILIRMGMRSVLFEQILPNLDKSMDLEKWNTALGQQINSTQRHAQILRGDWNYFNENYTYLLFDEIPDPEQTAIAYAQWVKANTDRYENMNFSQWRMAKEMPQAPFTNELSREGAALLHTMSIGSKNWCSGFLRSAVVEHYYAAAMDLLIREQKGEDLSRLTETFLPNPFTGKPFKYNPATRTLDAVPEADGGDIKALKLPW